MEIGTCDISHMGCDILTLVNMAIFHDSVEITTESTSVARFLQYLLKTVFSHLEGGFPCKYWHFEANCDDSSCTYE